MLFIFSLNILARFKHEINRKECHYEDLQKTPPSEKGTEHQDVYDAERYQTVRYCKESGHHSVRGESGDNRRPGHVGALEGFGVE